MAQSNIEVFFRKLTHKKALGAPYLAPNFFNFLIFWGEVRGGHHIYEVGDHFVRVDFLEVGVAIFLPNFFYQVFKVGVMGGMDGPMVKVDNPLG